MARSCVKLAILAALCATETFSETTARQYAELNASTISAAALLGLADVYLSKTCCSESGSVAVSRDDQGGKRDNQDGKFF